MSTVNTSGDETEITGFWYSTDEEIAGEPQFAIDMGKEYADFLEAFGAEATDTEEEFNDRYDWIDADALADDAQLRSNILNSIDYVYDDRISAFIIKHTSEDDDDVTAS